MEQQIEESERKLRHVLSSASESFYVVDKNYCITLLSKVAEKHLTIAWAKPVTLGAKIFDLIPEEKVQQIKENLEKVFKGQKIEYELQSSAKGLPDRVLVSYIPVYDDDGLITGAFIDTRDITERKIVEEKLKKSNERFETIASTTYDAIWEWNLETNELWGNPTHQQLYGLTNNQVQKL